MTVQDDISAVDYLVSDTTPGSAAAVIQAKLLRDILQEQQLQTQLLRQLGQVLEATRDRLPAPQQVTYGADPVVVRDVAKK